LEHDVHPVALDPIEVPDQPAGEGLTDMLTVVRRRNDPGSPRGFALVRTLPVSLPIRDDHQPVCQNPLSVASFCSRLAKASAGQP
jgi:hypothetical protein